MEFKGAELILLADMDAYGIQYIHPLGMGGMGASLWLRLFYCIEIVCNGKNWVNWVIGLYDLSPMKSFSNHWFDHKKDADNHHNTPA